MIPGLEDRSGGRWWSQEVAWKMSGEKPVEVPGDPSQSRLLDEGQAFALCARLAVRTPRRAYVHSPDEVETLDLGEFPGSRVVVKLVSRSVAHKAELGGVTVCRRTDGSLRQVVTDMFARFGSAASAVGIYEHIDGEGGPAGELLLGVRSTPDFGPVVTLGLGGIAVGRLAGWEPFHLADGGAWRRDPRRVMADHSLTAFISSEHRGRSAAITPDRLQDLLSRCLELGAGEAGAGFELEINPLVLVRQEPVALDILVLAGERATVRAERPVDTLEGLFRPQAIAVAGVSRRKNPGRVILENILGDGFEAASVFVLKEGVEEVLGCRALPGVEALPEAVDLIVLAVAAPRIPEYVEKILALPKARAIVVIPGGLGEREGTESDAQRVVEALARSRASGETQALLVGGNSLGVRSRPGGFDTLFIPREKLAYASAGESGLALISQSGAFAVARSSSLWTLDPRYVVSVGNQLDATVGDFLTFLERDEGVRVFSCYVEGFRELDGRRFLAAVEKIYESGRPVVLYRAGRTREGARAAVTHTAAVAGEYPVTRQLAERAGALVADSMRDFEDLTRTLSMLARRQCSGSRLGALSNAGFECVAIADRLGSLRLAELSAESRGRLGNLLENAGVGSIVGVQNPLDLTPMVGDRDFAVAASIVIGDPGVDVAVIGCVPLTPALQTLAAGARHSEDSAAPDALAERLAELWRKTTKPWVVVADGGPLYESFRQLLGAAGIPTFTSVDQAVEILERCCRWQLSTRG